MSTRIKEKLNWLQQHLPEGLVVDASWLEGHGYSRALRKKYVAGGWLKQVVRGVFVRPPAQLQAPGDSERLRWQHVVISLQNLLGSVVVVGGRTALELQGYAHYLSPTGPREVHLYGQNSPPRWVNRLPLDVKFVFHHAQKLFTGHPLSMEAPTEDVVRQAWGQWQWPLTLSSPERAFLELLDEIPQRETFHQADVLVEGLRTLSPRRLQKLLLACRSVKVKRLFFWFAERHNHAWLNQIDRTGIDLGHGKRMLVRHGKLDPKFNITVPENLDAGG